MLRLELSEAFDIRKKVVIILALVGIMLGLGGTVLVRSLWFSWFRNLAYT